MRRTMSLVLSAAFLALFVVAKLPAGAQQPQQVYTLDWWTVDGGGDTFSISRGVVPQGELEIAGAVDGRVVPGQVIMA